MAVNAKLRQYQKNQLRDEVLNADPHRLIELLLAGALEKISVSKHYMQEGNIEEKCKHIGLAIDIVAGLQASLNREEGGALAEKLDRVYSAMQARLLNANINNDLAGLDEVHRALSNIREGWNAIPQDVRDDFSNGKLQQENDGNRV